MEFTGDEPPVPRPETGDATEAGIEGTDVVEVVPAAGRQRARTPTRVVGVGTRDRAEGPERRD